MRTVAMGKSIRIRVGKEGNIFVGDKAQWAPTYISRLCQSFGPAR